MPFSFLRKLSRRRRRDDNNIAEPSPHPAVPKMRGSAPPALPTQQHNSPENNLHGDAYKTEKHDSGCAFDIQPDNASKSDTDQSHPDVRGFIEQGVDPSDQEPAFTWQDIEPRAELDRDRDLSPPPIEEFFNYELSPDEKDKLLNMDSTRETVDQLPPPSHPRSANAIAEAHLSTTPEEQNRLSALHRALQARLLGLPSYNEVSGAVIVDHEGLPHSLSPQEEEERQASLRRAVEERMLGLPRRTTFSWAKTSRGTSLPAYLSGAHK
jgi:hypothetical protein